MQIMLSRTNINIIDNKGYENHVIWRESSFNKIWITITLLVIYVTVKYKNDPNTTIDGSI